jgi:cysteine desulfurase NifS
MCDAIYLDYNATTPIDPVVAEAMRPFLSGGFGNPSSNHVFGSAARQAVENARDHVAEMLGSERGEIIFTSGGTESNNLAIRGFASANKDKGNHIITSAVEHPAVLEVCEYLARTGFDLTVLPVDHLGRIQIADLEDAIRDDTILISIMHANNEVGTIQPIQEIAQIAHSHNIMMHSDAAQSIGKIPVAAESLGVDLLSIAGHKLYAPKGIGALYVRKGILLEKQTYGANHERDLRPGTENVLGIVGLGAACELVSKNLFVYAEHYSAMRDLFEELLNRENLQIKINGDKVQRLPNTSSIGFKGVKANEVIEKLKQIAVSAGAACHAENITISHVLRAMHVPEEYAQGTIRFSTGRETTSTQIQNAVEQIARVIGSV